MARPEKHTADYFPFYVKDGKTLFILESKYGCKGTGFFTNVLRFLCDNPDHHYSIKEESDRLFFFSKTRCDEESGMDMLNIMAKTGKILSSWWVSSAVIYSPDLINSLKDAYRSRRNTLLTHDEIMVIHGIKSPGGELSASETPQADGILNADNPQKKRKEKKRNNPLTPLTISQQKLFDKFYSAYPNKKSKGQAEKAFSKIDPDEQLLATMVATIERAKTHDVQWLKDNGAFIPHPATWLNAKGWEDEIKSSSGNTQAEGSPYIECPRCHAEVLENQFIEIDGGKYCEKCPEAKDSARKAYEKLSVMMGSVGKEIPKARAAN